MCSHLSKQIQIRCQGWLGQLVPTAGGICTRNLGFYVSSILCWNSSMLNTHLIKCLICLFHNFFVIGGQLLEPRRNARDGSPSTVHGEPNLPHLHVPVSKTLTVLASRKIFKRPRQTFSSVVGCTSWLALDNLERDLEFKHTKHTRLNIDAEHWCCCVGSTVCLYLSPTSSCEVSRLEFNSLFVSVKPKRRCMQFAEWGTCSWRLARQGEGARSKIGNWGKQQKNQQREEKTPSQEEMTREGSDSADKTKNR